MVGARARRLGSPEQPRKWERRRSSRAFEFAHQARVVGLAGAWSRGKAPPAEPPRRCNQSRSMKSLSGVSQRSRRWKEATALAGQRKIVCRCAPVASPVPDSWAHRAPPRRQCSVCGASSRAGGALIGIGEAWCSTMRQPWGRRRRCCCQHDIRRLACDVFDAELLDEVADVMNIGLSLDQQIGQPDPSPVPLRRAAARRHESRAVRAGEVRRDGCRQVRRPSAQTAIIASRSARAGRRKELPRPPRRRRRMAL